MNKSQKLAIGSMLVSASILLSCISFPLGFWTISFSCLPIFISACLFSPQETILIALAGAALEQFISYGLSLTTPLWLLPAIARAAYLSLALLKYRNNLNTAPLMKHFIISNLICTAVTTIAMIADSIYFGYFYWSVIGISLLCRLISSVTIAILCGLVTFPILKAIKANEKGE